MSVAVAHQINKASDVVLAAAVSEAALRGLGSSSSTS